MFKVGDVVMYEGEVFVLGDNGCGVYPFVTNKPTKRHGCYTTFTLDGKRLLHNVNVNDSDSDRIRKLTKLERALQ